MDEKKINKNLKNCPKSSRFTVPKPAKKLQILPKNIKQPFWEEEQRAALSKEILGARISNFDMKDLSLKVDKFKAANIKNIKNIWAKIT